MPTRKGCLPMLCVTLACLVFVHQVQAISSRSLTEVADISTPVVSPDGTRVAFRVEQASIERNTYDSVWYIQDMDGASPARRVADGGVPLRDTAGLSLPATAVWAPDGRWIYYRALMGGRIKVWRAATDGSKAVPITFDSADVRDFSLSADGQVLRYSIGASREEVVDAEQAEYDRGIRIEKGVPVGQNLFRSGNIEGRLATQRYTGLGADREALLGSVPDRWKAVMLTSGAVEMGGPPLEASRQSTSSGLAREAADYWRSARESGGQRIALLTRSRGDGPVPVYSPGIELSVLPSASAQKAVKCKAEECTDRAITNVQWRPGSDEVIFTVTDREEGHAQSVARWNVNTGEVHPVATATGLINGGRDPNSACGVSSEALVCVAADARRPPRLERIDLNSGERKLLFDPNDRLAHDMRKGVDVQFLRWTDAGGQVFTGQFFQARRTGGAAPPLFVTYYSCFGFVRGGLGDEWPMATLAQKGISALCINAAPFRLDAVERFDQGLSAVESAIDLLASTDEIDRSKVGIGGLSFGTEVALWVAMKSDLLAAVSVSSVTVSPVYYLLNMLEGEGFTRALKEVWGLGAPEETPERWQALSPALNLEKIRAPVLFQVSEQEYLFALDSMLPLVRDGRGDLYVFPNEPHQKFQPRHKLAVYERNLDWFRFWLQGHEDADPEKARQYLHWRGIEAAMQEAAK